MKSYKPLFVANFYLGVLFYYPISMNIQIVLEWFLLYNPAVVFGLAFLLFLSQFLFDYYTFYEFHSIEIKGPILMLLNYFVLVSAVSIRSYITPDSYSIIVLIMFNISYLIIFKYEYRRVKDGIERIKLLFLFKSDKTWVKKKKQIIIIYTLITVYQVIVFIMFLISEKMRSGS